MKDLRDNRIAIHFHFLIPYVGLIQWPLFLWNLIFFPTPPLELNFSFHPHLQTTGYSSNIPELKYSNHMASNCIYRMMLSKLKKSASHSRLAYSNNYLTSPWVPGRHLKFTQCNPWFPGSHVFSISGNTTSKCQLESPSTLTLSLSLPSANPA